MTQSHLKQGQKLYQAMGPMDIDGNVAGGRIGHDGVTEIVVGQLCGPMGHYDVAIISRESGETITPLHMADDIRPLPDPA